MMKDRFFKDALGWEDIDKAYSAYKEGVRSWKSGYDEQVREGYVNPEKEPFQIPSREDAISQGLTFFEDNEDVVEITEEEAKSIGIVDYRG